MSGNNLSHKIFDAFGGLNLKVSDLLRNQADATQIKNMSMRKTGAMSKRKGFQINARSRGGYGLTSFQNIDIDTGDTTEELLTVDQNLYRLDSDSFVVTYTGSTTAYYDLYVHTDNKFYYDVYENGARVLNYDLGTGKETSYVSLANLITQVNALTNFTAVASGIDTEAAAFIPVTNAGAISSSGTTITFDKWTQIDTPNGITNPLSAYYAKRNELDFENASFATVNNVLYVATGHSDLHKYDGLRFYKAGIASPTTAPSVAASAGAGALSGTYQYKYLYRYIDAKGNIIESNATEATSIVLATKDGEVTVENLQTTSDYNTDQAVVNGNQVGVTTITVTSGHDIKVGDKVYFLDGVSGDYVTRDVTSITTTSITISGAAVNVNNAEIINPQLKIVILRTVDTGTLFYELVELVNDSSTATQLYVDSVADSNLVIEYIEPAKLRDLPPKCKYIDVWRNILIMTGSPTEPNKVYYSDIEGAEYFPSLQNNFIVESNDGSKNSGIRSLDNILYVFKKNSIAGVTGDLGLDQFQVDIISKQGVGCQAHGTLSEVNGSIWFLSQYGVYSISGQGLRKESDNIDPKFNRPNSFNFNRATAYYYIDAEQYILQLPITATSSGNIYYDSTSEVYVYDVTRGAWLQWSNFDIGGGMAEYNGSLYFQSKEINISATQIHYLKKVHDSGLTQDYCDHEDAIEFQYKSHWETLGEPSLFKKFLRIKVHSLDASLNNFESEGFNLTVKTEHDYLASTISSLTMDFSGGAEGWGLSPWGSFPWGEKRLSGLKSKLNSRKAKSIRVVFENSTLAENILISGFTLDTVIPYRLRMKE